MVYHWFAGPPAGLPRARRAAASARKGFSHTDMISVPPKAKGVACIVSAAFFFSLMALFVRLSGELPVMQKAFFRNVVAALVAFRMMSRGMRRAGFVSVVARNWPGLSMRTVLGTLGLVCNFWAIGRMPLADANMLNKMAPFFAVLMSAPIVRERPRGIDLLCVAGAFAGSLLVMKPGAGMASVPALVALAGGFFAGTAYAYIRQMGTRGVPGPVIIFFFSAFSSLICLPFVVFGHAPMSVRQAVFLLLAGLAAAGGQVSVTAAYACAPAKEISVFDYSQVLFAAVFGLWFSELPDSRSLAGYAVIIGMAILRWRLNLRSTNAEDSLPTSHAETP